MELSDHNPVGSSSFSSLPVGIQLSILGTLNFKAQKRARLVCADWYSLINYVSKPTYKISAKNASLIVLKKTYNQMIDGLRVIGVTKPLQIISSTRTELPHVKTLILGYGVSAENIQKLLRYSTKYCEELELEYLCFADIAKPQVVGRCFLGNVKRLEIALEAKTINTKVFRVHSNRGHPFTSEERIEQKRHILSLGQFLHSCRIPNLRELTLNIESFCWRDVDTNVNSIAYNKFYSSFSNFLRKYGQQIKTLHLDMANMRMRLLPILEPLAYLVNLKELVIDFETVFRRAFESLLENNHQTLTLVTCENMNLWSFSLQWLTSIHKLANLKKLAFAFTCRSDDQLLPLVNLPNLKLEHVTTLKISIQGRGDWRDILIQWIIHSLPSLYTLELDTYASCLKPADLLRMIYGFPKLRKIEFEYFSNDNQADSPKFGSTRCNQIPQIHFKTRRYFGARRSYIIWVDRPFPEGLQV